MGEKARITLMVEHVGNATVLCTLCVQYDRKHEVDIVKDLISEDNDLKSFRKKKLIWELSTQTCS